MSLIQHTRTELDGVKMHLPASPSSFLLRSLIWEREAVRHVAAAWEESDKSSPKQLRPHCIASSTSIMDHQKTDIPTSFSTLPKYLPSSFDLFHALPVAASVLLSWDSPPGVFISIHVTTWTSNCLLHRVSRTA